MGGSARCGRKDDHQNYRSREITPLRFIFFLAVHVLVMVCHERIMSRSVTWVQFRFA
jgi:hypothetical protein